MIKAIVDIFLSPIIDIFIDIMILIVDITKETIYSIFRFIESLFGF